MTDLKIVIQSLVPEDLLTVAGVDTTSDESVAEFVQSFLTVALPPSARNSVQVSVTVERVVAGMTDADRDEAARLTNRNDARAAFTNAPVSAANLVEGSDS